MLYLFFIICDRINMEMVSVAVKNKKNAPAKNAGEIAVGTSQSQLVWRQFKKNKGAMLGIAFLILLFVATLVSPLLWDYDTQILGMNARDGINHLRELKDELYLEGEPEDYTIDVVAIPKSEVSDYTLDFSGL